MANTAHPPARPESPFSPAEALGPPKAPLTQLPILQPGSPPSASRWQHSGFWVPTFWRSPEPVPRRHSPSALSPAGGAHLPPQLQTLTAPSREWPLLQEALRTEPEPQGCLQPRPAHNLRFSPLPWELGIWADPGLRDAEGRGGGQGGDCWGQGQWGSGWVDPDLRDLEVFSKSVIRDLTFSSREETELVLASAPQQVWVYLPAEHHLPPPPRSAPLGLLTFSPVSPVWVLLAKDRACSSACGHSDAISQQPTKSNAEHGPVLQRFPKL